MRIVLTGSQQPVFQSVRSIEGRMTTKFSIGVVLEKGDLTSLAVRAEQTGDKHARIQHSEGRWS